MTEAGIYTTNTLVGYKAGASASATSKAEAYTNEFINQAESFINVVTKKVWATNTAGFTALTADVKKLLSEAASDLAAIYVINYETSGFAEGRAQAELMINVLYQRFTDCINLLKEPDNFDFMAGA